MPTATVPSHTPTPARPERQGPPPDEKASQATAAPARNGQAVARTPVMTSPRAWASRPIAAKARIRDGVAEAAHTVVRRDHRRRSRSGRDGTGEAAVVGEDMHPSLAGVGPWDRRSGFRTTVPAPGAAAGEPLCPVVSRTRLGPTTPQCRRTVPRYSRPARGHNKRMRRGQKITTCLWFDNQAEEAADFYVSVFDGSEGARCGPLRRGRPRPRRPGHDRGVRNRGPEVPAPQRGARIHVQRGRLLRHRLLLAGGSGPLLVGADAGGTESQCGWLKDKFGVSWQVVPSALGQLLGGPDPEGAQRAMQAMLGCGSWRSAPGRL